ncbi:MAG: carbohydrate ABC transporter permease, partial [Clostridiales bacterium]|nr:carbohydrate ABC transporter permease [Clostridiales bacterium]
MDTHVVAGYKRKPLELAFDITNVALMLGMIIVCVYPMLYVLFASISEPNLLSASRGPLILPLGFTLDGYALVLRNETIPLGYRNTLIYVVGNWLIGITLTVSFAYVLSRKNFMLRGFLTRMIIVTMFFSGGMIPTYLVISGLNFVDTIWAIIIPGSLSTMNVIIMR